MHIFNNKKSWLDELTPDFEIKALKRLALINPDVLPEDTDPDYEIEYVDISNVDSTGRILGTEHFVFSEAPSRARRTVKHGDTIISTVRTYLRAIATITDPPENLVVSTGFLVARPDNHIHPGFLSWVLRSPGFVEAIVANSYGVSYPAIAPSDLANICVPIPSISQQRGIANYLNRETVQLDELIGAKERLLQALIEKRQALITQVITHGLDLSAPLKESGLSWVSKVPAHWTLPPVRARYEVQLGKMLDEKRITGDLLAPYLRNIDVQWDKINTIDLPQMDFTEEDRCRFALRKGDILVCEGGDVGRSAIWQGELDDCFYQKALHRLRPITKNDMPEYFILFMKVANGLGVFNADGNASTIAHLPAEKLRNVRYPAPPLEEQKAIVTHIQEALKHIQNAEEMTHKSLSLLSQRRMALIVAAVTGQIKGLT